MRWRDFWLPADRDDFADALVQLLEQTARGRAEIACGGGTGRTGTALACLAVLDGLRNDEAIRYVRENYSTRAVETPWQRRFVGGFTRRRSPERGDRLKG